MPDNARKAAEMAARDTVWIDYTNHRGERGIRHVRPLGIEFHSTEWHPAPQWLLSAFDMDKLVWRNFAMKDVHAWSDTPFQASATRPVADRSKASAVAAEASQVIGALADTAGLFEHPEVQRALVYFSRGPFDGSVLPFVPDATRSAADPDGQSEAVRRTVLDWIRDVAPLTVKMTLLPAHVDALVSALTSPARARGEG